jgi:3D (Asp-Asp-Asp) domain-containing protein
VAAGGGGFKLSFYSSSGRRGSGGKLIHKQTVAMNRDQMASLGISFGSQIYLVSQKGWSGWYTVTDTGVDHGTVDIFLENYSELPWWGVERGIAIVY